MAIEKAGSILFRSRLPSGHSGIDNHPWAFITLWLRKSLFLFFSFSCHHSRMSTQHRMDFRARAHCEEGDYVGNREGKKCASKTKKDER